MSKEIVTGLFCFDGPLYKDKNGVYCNITLTNEMFSRYFCVVDKLYIVVRTFYSKATHKEMNMRTLNLRNITVVEAENFNTLSGILFKKKQFKKRICHILDDVDLIFARMPSQTSNAILELAQKKKKPYLVEVGGCAWDSFWNHGIMGKLIAPYMYYNAKKNIKRAQYATYVTKSFLQNRYPCEGKCINCSNVYLTNFSSNTLEQRLNKISKMDRIHPVFGQAVNSIDVKYKGEHHIIKAMSILKKQGIYPTFEIVGPGSGSFLKKTAQKYGIETQIKIIGTLSKQQVEDWIQKIDLYVQPSKQEGLPRSVIEAMNLGCPAVGSNIAGIPELLDKECLFNPDDTNEIVKTLLWVLEKNNMTSQAKTNFERSKDYALDKLEKKRNAFFEQYRKEILENQ